MSSPMTTKDAGPTKRFPLDYPEAMASISRGLDQSKRGETSYLGSFAKEGGPEIHRSELGRAQREGKK